MANPKTFSWVLPTANTDGSPIAPGELTGIQIGIRRSTDPVGTYHILMPVDDATATTDPISELQPPLATGSYFAAAQALSVNGPSAWSAEAPFSWTALPNPPTGFSVA